MDVLSKDGANIGLDLTYRYRPVPSELGYLHDDLGPNYASTVIMPEVRSSAREVIGKYKPDELYSADRGKIQQQIFNTTKASLDKKHIQLDKILIRSIQLPKNITRYIEQKLQQEQKALEYKFRISREKQEAERKRIEAEGIKKQMQIINEGLTPNFLTYKGIEATQKLSESDNSKVIVIGGGDNGMPLILGGQ
jgi:regulator of protease activity HflC (stomatin/prohibitin superfamily)